MELQFLFSAYRQMMLYICTNFCDKFLNSFKVIEGNNFDTHKYKEAQFHKKGKCSYSSCFLPFV